MNDKLYLPVYVEPLCLSEPVFQLSQWIIDWLEESGNHAFETMVEQMNINPDAIEALYGE